MTEAEEAVPTFEPEETVQDSGDGDSSRDVIGEIGEVAERVVQALSSGVEDAEDSLRDGLVQAEETVRQHPLAALGVAAGVGFLVGVLVSRSRE
jgi:ElaB/YqjD/DUF883 family membrane-anchored ribosome-binding protein